MADNRKIAEDVLAAVGGTGNVANVTHCMTRLRLNLKDDGIPDDDAVKNISGVLGVARSGGQYQVIIGQNVPRVYKEVLEIGGFAAQTQVDEKLEGAKETFSLKKLGSGILNYMSGSLTPLIPVLLAAGLFRAMSSVLGPTMFGVISAESSLYILLDFMYDAGLYFFPILLGFTAAKKLGATEVLGAFMGAILIAPDFVVMAANQTPFDIFGIPVTMNDYSQSVMPALLSVFVMANVEKFLKKRMPDVLTTIFTPFLTIAITTPVALIALAPLGSILGAFICKGLIAFGNVGGFVAVAVVAALWEFLVMGGMHMIIIVMMITMLAENGYVNGALVAGTYATFACFGVAVGAFLRMKDKEEKATALGCVVGGLLGGVTEPTLYGLCFAHKRTFIGLVIGGALGGAYAGLTNVAMYAFAGSNVLMVIGFAGENQANLINGIIACGLAMVGACVSTYLLGFEKDDPAIIGVTKVSASEVAVNEEIKEFAAPISGQAIK